MRKCFYAVLLGITLISSNSECRGLGGRDREGGDLGERRYSRYDDNYRNYNEDRYRAYRDYDYDRYRGGNMYRRQGMDDAAFYEAGVYADDPGYIPTPDANSYNDVTNPQPGSNFDNQIWDFNN